MARMITIQAETRDTAKGLKTIRKAGKMPAVFYGKKESSTPITITVKEFMKVWKEGGESSVITIERSEGKVEALIKDVEFDAVTGNPLHADFYVFEKGHALEVKVSLEFTGEAPAEKELGAIIVKVLHEIEIKAQPQDLPHEIIIDLSVLVKLEDQITAADIKLPKGVELVQNPEDVVVLVTMPVEEKEEEVPVDLDSIEVAAKGKEAKEGEEEAAPSDE